MKSFDLPKISEDIERFCIERDWDQFHSVKNLCMALSVESSELLELYQWLTEADSDKVSQNPTLRDRTEEEVADIAIYLIRLLQKTKIDLQLAIERKMQKNAVKYPVALSKGSSKKYDEL